MENDPGGQQPYAIARADGAPLALAGIWSKWKSPGTGEVTQSFAIVTTAASATMQQLYARMPAILEPDDWPVWLGELDGTPLELLRPLGKDVLRLWPVSSAVNDVRNNRPDLLDPMDAPLAPSSARPGSNPA